MNCRERSKRLNVNRWISETSYARRISTGAARKKPEPCSNASLRSTRNSRTILPGGRSWNVNFRPDRTVENKFPNVMNFILFIDQKWHIV